MIKVYCDNCGTDITNQQNAYPNCLLRYKKHFCDVDCRTEHDKRNGHYKRMSDLGRAGRSRVMPISNKEKPRRRRKTIS
jgi:hypothetical protein